MEMPLLRADNRVAVRDDLTPLLDRIRVLAERQPNGSPDRLLEELEHTLTDGYALALALEGEGLRIEKEIGAAASAPPGDELDAARLEALGKRLLATKNETVRLRAHLASLHIRTEAIRTTALSR
jgi:hypothetical protein